MHFSEKIRLSLTGKSAAKLAASVGLHKSAIRDCANTRRVPRADKAIKIARALGVSADWLFDDAQDWPPPESPFDSRSCVRAACHVLTFMRDLINRSEKFLVSQSGASDK